METLLNNVFFQVFILTASVAGSFWYLKREQRKEDESDDSKPKDSQGEEIIIDSESEKDQLFVNLFESLKSEPDEWQIVGNYVKHADSGVIIWNPKGTPYLCVDEPSVVHFPEKQREALLNVLGGT